MPYYESVFLVRADVSSQQVEALAKSFNDIIVDNGGSVAKTEHWGLRTLAYRIKKNRKAHYVLFNIDAPPAAIQEMERNMRLNEDVLRTLTLRVDELEEEPSAILAAKGRDDRGRRDRGPRSDGPPGKPALAAAPKAAAPEKASAIPEKTEGADEASSEKAEANSDKGEATSDKVETSSDKGEAKSDKGEAAADKGEDK